MNSTERIGFGIVMVVFVFLVAVLLVAQLSSLLALGNAPNVAWLKGGRVLLTTVVVLVGFGYLGRSLWEGRELARRVCFIGLIIMGAGYIGLAVWMTTLDYPSATTPEVRAEMQADDRQQLPWRIGQGLVPIVVGGLLLLPPVGRFLSYRRAVVSPGTFGTDRRFPK